MIEISAKIYPTESEEKVLTTLKNIFPEMGFSKEDDEFIGKSDKMSDLDYIKQRINSKLINNTVLELFEKNQTLRLNKQTAFIGKVNFLDREITPALGCIKLKIDLPPEEFKKWLEE